MKREASEQKKLKPQRNANTKYDKKQKKREQIRKTADRKFWKEKCKRDKTYSFFINANQYNEVSISIISGKCQKKMFTEMFVFPESRPFPVTFLP